jgi:hypothetical protein
MVCVLYGVTRVIPRIRTNGKMAAAIIRRIAKPRKILKPDPLIT